MADTVRGKVAEAGNAVAEAAQKAGNRIAEGAAATKDWATRKLEKAQHRVEEKADEIRHDSEAAEIDREEGDEEGGEDGGEEREGVQQVSTPAASAARLRRGRVFLRWLWGRLLLVLGHLPAPYSPQQTCHN